MALDIEFLQDSKSTAELNGQQLTSVPGFFNVVRVLGPVLEHLKSGDDDLVRCYRRATAYADGCFWAEQRFLQYLAFGKKLADTAGREDFPTWLDDYHPIARRLSAALMLRDDPVTPEDASRILEFFFMIRRFVEMAGPTLPGVGDGGLTREIVASAAQALGRYNECLDLASEENVAFRISF